ncbi:DUF805 domain-containing protein [Hymenobacter glaciei]|uniref:DUF805 domain-containing protein n=1 Tax=Hymenobacter glaciei TaxID=877209 RepID=A0ABP7UNI6_9BACT
MDYFLEVLKKYAVFSGRARRKEYWMFVLFNFLFSIVAGIADYVLTGTGSGVISGLYALAVIIPGLAVGIRRLHDIGKSGWFTLIIFVPLVGAIWLLVLACTEENAGDNEYGPDPKAQFAY